MSKSGASKVETIWTKLESQAERDVEEAASETTTLLVGDGACGKTSLINNTFKASSSKAPKPTFALEYTFARKKNAGSGTGPKSVAHVWELGGGINELKLLNVPLSPRVLSTTTLVVCCDLSKPQNAASSLKRWIDALKEVLVKGLGKEAYKRMRENARTANYEGNPDRTKVSPFPVPLFVVGTKYDHVRNMTTADRRSLLQLLRFFAHYHGATLLCSSSADATMRDSFKSVFGSICFATGLRNLAELAADKPVMVSAGKDSFSGILSSTISVSEAKAKLVYSEADIPSLIGCDNESMPRGVWSRIEDHTASLFGSPDAVGVDGANAESEPNDFPEPEIDSKRAEKDEELAKYVQDAERREALHSRMQEPLDVPGSTTDKRGKDSDGVAASGSGAHAEDEKNDSSSRSRNRPQPSSTINENRSDILTQENAEELSSGRRHRK